MSLSRRSFLATSTLGGTALAADPFGRKGKPRLRLALAAYSFRSFFKFQKNTTREVPKQPMDMFKFIDFCAANGCDGAELTSYFFRHNVTRDYLIALRRHAFLRGVDISGSAAKIEASSPLATSSCDSASFRSWLPAPAAIGPAASLAGFVE